MLGLLRGVGHPVSVSDVERALVGWIPARSCRKEIHSLAVTPNLVEVSVDQFVSLRSKWQAELAEWIAVHPSCVDQLARRTHLTTRERAIHRSKIASGRLSDSEEREMKRQPCVFCGRRFPRKQMTLEHWPPRKFMQQHGIPDSTHVVWPMCKGDNDRLGKFIQHKMPATLKVRHGEVHGVEIHQALQIFLAVAEIQQVRYFDAYRRGDIEAATKAVERVIQAWLDLSEQRGLSPRSTGTVRRRRRKSANRRTNYVRPGLSTDV
ncbi:HNH endonuclease [Ilumatobacteraceae bacterium]|nr:HNH endonuclease [Ilumatobacteraceae bacterium]